MLELGLRVGGAPIKRHFDLSSFAKGPDGPSGAPRKRHFDLSCFAKGPDGSSGARTYVRGLGFWVMWLGFGVRF